MVTDRKIIVSNGNTSVELTAMPYTVQKTEGFDRVEVKNVTSQGFDQDGASLINSYVMPRDMGITGQIKADTTHLMQRCRDKLFDLFVPDKEVVVTHYYGGVNRVINAIVEKTPRFEFTDVSAVQNYEISLKAMYPFWRDEKETLIQIANVRGSFHFPLVIPRDRGVCFGIRSSSLIANIYNKSSIRIGMRIEFIARGAVTNPMLFDINTRKFIKLLCSMEAGEKITVETGTDNSITRRKSGISEDYIGKIDLAGGGDEFLELAPGNNIFRYGAEAGENLLEVRIYYQNKYQGV